MNSSLSLECPGELRTADARAARRKIRSIDRLLSPLQTIVSSSLYLVSNHGPSYRCAEQAFRVPGYIFTGPKSGDDPLRIGIFAGVHGDEIEGVHVLIRFLARLESEPELASGYSIFAYPVCNPTGFEDATRLTRSGKDLNREFWQQSTEPEVTFLESELQKRSFHGIISLHTDDTSHGFYGFAQGATLTSHLIKPALEAASEFLPLNREEQIDGFRARNGVIRSCYTGVLSAPPKQRPKPFDIILETPQAPPTFLKEAALLASLRTIIIRYREFIAYAPNL